jgi:hypothetical protein
VRRAAPLGLGLSESDPSSAAHERASYEDDSLVQIDIRASGVIVVVTRAGSYEERICLRCFEGRVYDVRRDA